VLQENVEQLEHKELEVPKELEAWVEKLVKQDWQEKQDPRDQLDMLEIEVHKEILELLERKDQEVLLDLWEIQDLQAQMA